MLESYLNRQHDHQRFRDAVKIEANDPYETFNRVDQFAKGTTLWLSAS